MDHLSISAIQKKKIFVGSAIFFISFLILFSLFSFPEAIEAIEEEGIDYVLIIDESGSMKQNDPENLRIEAAKLFVDLSSILGTGNRIAVVGFGENTNVYLDFTVLEDNSQSIKDALENIKSDQPLTDVKDVLLKVKEMFDEREKKNESAVILLTDGSMTIEDIPPIPQEETQEPDQGDEEQEEREIPAGQISREEGEKSYTQKGSEDEDQAPVEPEEEPDDIQGQKVDSQKAYLEQYKQEVLQISQKYDDEGISINTIAFTEEAEIDILSRMSSITDAGNWRARSAADIKDIYLEIFKHITSRFLFREKQKDTNPITGEIITDDTYDNLVLISFDNDLVKENDISLTDREGNEYRTNITEKTYKILEISRPIAGDWEYEIMGDAVIVYDFGQLEVLRPEGNLFISGSKIDFEVAISKAREDSPEIDPELFTVSYNIRFPDGVLFEEKSFDYAGSNTFRIFFDNLDASGNYNAEIIVEHLPSGASSLKKINIESVYLGVDIEVIEPSRQSYRTDEKIPVSVSIVKKSDADDSMVIDSMEVFMIADGFGDERIYLNDDGTGEDENAGDSIFNALLSSRQTGDKELALYVYYSPVSSREIDTGIRRSFEVVSDIVPEEKTTSEEETPKGQGQATVENKEDKEEEKEIIESVDIYWKIIVLAASILSLVIIFLIVYFLYIRPRKRGY